jgi:hypothetical protein
MRCAPDTVASCCCHSPSTSTLFIVAAAASLFLSPRTGYLAEYREHQNHTHTIPPPPPLVLYPNTPRISPLIVDIRQLTSCLKHLFHRLRHDSPALSSDLPVPAASTTPRLGVAPRTALPTHAAQSLLLDTLIPPIHTGGASL